MEISAFFPLVGISARFPFLPSQKCGTRISKLNGNSGIVIPKFMKMSDRMLFLWEIVQLYRIKCGDSLSWWNYSTSGILTSFGYM